MLVAALILTSSVARLASAQATARVTVRGVTGQTRTLSLSDLGAMTRHETTVTAHNVSGRYAGVAMSDLLALVGAPHGDSLRGLALAQYVLVEAADHYRVVFSLADFDPGYTDRVVILADHRDGAPLPASEGPFRLIVPGEYRPARWVRSVTQISVLRAATP